MIAAAVLVSFLAAASPASDLTVIVTDPSGGRVPGATVQGSTAGGELITAVTNSRGEAVLAGLSRGEQRVRVTLSGFETWERAVKVRDGASPVEARLALAKLAEDVSVRPEEAASAGLGYKTVLTEADLANLPDDPDELEAALRAIAGPQAAMRVNGFSGGRLPPKSQIRQVRFVMNPYAAEFHESQPVFIDVQTKPGLGEWSRSTRLGFRDESLNSNTPLAPSRAPDSYRRYGFDLSGPLVKGRTSLAVTADARLTDTARTVRAQTSEGALSQLADSSTDRVDLSARLEHSWGRTHTLQAEFESLSRTEEGLGIGGLDLPERGLTQDRQEFVARFADNGVIFGRVASEQRFRFRSESVDFTSASSSPAVRVMGAFNAGGAGVAGGRRSRDFEWASNFDLSVGKKHALRGGLLVRDLEVTSDERRNYAGTYTFADLAGYEAFRPVLFTARTGNPKVSLSHTEWGVYVQDEARLRKNLTVAAGLRVEGQSQVENAFNLAPRAGLTYSPDSRTTLRAGAGRFFGWYEADIYETTLRLDGTRESDLTIAAPAWPDAFAGGSGVSARATRWTASSDLALPRTLRASLGIERNFGRVRVSADYAWQRGSRELRSRTRASTSTGLWREIESSASSVRHVLDTRINLMPQPNARFGFFLGYLWGKATNEANGALSLPADERNPGAERGPSASDARHRFFGLVNGRPFRSLAVSALISAQSGLPLDVTTGRDDNGDGVLNDRPIGMTRNSSRMPGRFSVDVRLGWSKSFGAVRTTRPGGGVRVVRIGDGEGAPDMGDGGEPRRYRVGVYLQAFNALNRTNPTAVGAVFGSPLFSQVLAAEPGRRVELGTTLSF